MAREHDWKDSDRMIGSSFGAAYHGTVLTRYEWKGSIEHVRNGQRRCEAEQRQDDGASGRERDFAARFLDECRVIDVFSAIVALLGSQYGLFLLLTS